MFGRGEVGREFNHPVVQAGPDALLPQCCNFRLVGEPRPTTANALQIIRYTGKGLVVQRQVNLAAGRRAIVRPLGQIGCDAPQRRVEKAARHGTDPDARHRREGQGIKREHPSIAHLLQQTQLAQGGPCRA